MYSLYKQIHEPTVVEHTASAKFTSPNTTNLIVAKTSILEVYEVKIFNKKNPSSKLKPAQNQHSRSKQHEKKLVLIGQYSLFGNVEGIGVVRLCGNKRDSLILVFRDAKFSIVDFDPSVMGIKTVSMHFYEDDEISGGILDTKPFQPLVRVDPENRCAVVLVYGHQLVIVPFREELMTGITDDTGAVASDRHDELPLGTGDGSHSHILPTYVRDLEKISKGIRNIKDVQFLHGYNEPTLIIMHEPRPTWTGRVSMRKDTVMLSAISLNLIEKREPIIWHVKSLPFDSIHIEPVPKPLRGVLVFAQNSILYLNQSNPVFGISLNEFGDNSKYNLKPHKGALCSLDCSHMTYLSKTAMLLSLKLGELYVLSLVNDGISVSDIRLERAGSSAIASSLVKLGKYDYIFLGSRVSDSHLISFTTTFVEDGEDVHEKGSGSARGRGGGTDGDENEIGEKTDEIGGGEDEDDQPNAKRRRMESDVVDEDDLLYDNDGPDEEHRAVRYHFNIEDSLPNIGPIRDVQIGEPAFLTDQHSLKEQYDIEVLTCSGYSKNGSLCSIQRGIRPDVISSHPLPTCVGLWAVKVNRSVEVEDNDKETPMLEESAAPALKPESGSATTVGAGGSTDDLLDSRHSYLLMSHEKSTTVLSTREELVEVKNTGFYTDGPTIGVGNVCASTYIVQVYPAGMRILHGEKQLQHISVDPNSAIRACSIVDPYVLLVLDNNTFSILREEGGSLVPVGGGGGVKNGEVYCAALFEDLSGMFVTPEMAGSSAEGSGGGAATAEAHVHVVDAKARAAEIMKAQEEDSDDDDLYGDEDSPPPPVQSEAGPATSEGGPRAEAEEEGRREKTFWMFICRENGNLEVYFLPDFKLRFMVAHIALSPTVLVDSFSSATVKPSAEDPFVKEVCMTSLHPDHEMPHLLFLLSTGDLIVYQPFSFVHTGHVEENTRQMMRSRLSLRFKRVRLDYIFRDPLSFKVDDGNVGTEADEDWKTPLGSSKAVEDVLRTGNKGSDGDDLKSDKERKTRLLSAHRQSIFPFRNIGGLTGAFVAGRRSLWLTSTRRGKLRVHGMHKDGQVLGFSEFNNINCEEGFIYYNEHVSRGYGICVFLSAFIDFEFLIVYVVWLRRVICASARCLVTWATMRRFRSRRCRCVRRPTMLLTTWTARRILSQQANQRTLRRNPGSLTMRSCARPSRTRKASAFFTH